MMVELTAVPKVVLTELLLAGPRAESMVAVKAAYWVTSSVARMAERWVA